MYSCKEGVIIAGLRPCMQLVIDVCVEVYNKHGKELVITSGLDGVGVHKVNSRHFVGEAIDTRTRFFNDVEKESVFQEIKQKLGCYFRIINESTHFHIQTVI